MLPTTSCLQYFFQQNARFTLLLPWTWICTNIRQQKRTFNTLQSFGYTLIEPTEGELASGLRGFGRLEEPENIFSIIKKALLPDSNLKGKKVLISAGPTYEPIDPVRFIGNRSSGLMGIELAMAFAKKGASVKLILGPTKYEVHHPHIQVENVVTASEMHNAVIKSFPGSDITVMAAAVADFTPIEVSKEKIKKAQVKMRFSLHQPSIF